MPYTSFYIFIQVSRVWYCSTVHIFSNLCLEKKIEFLHDSLRPLKHYSIPTLHRMYLGHSITRHGIAKQEVPNDQRHQM